MYELSYFIHIAGIILWIGAFFSFGLLLTGMIKKGDALERAIKSAKSLTGSFFPAPL